MRDSALPHPHLAHTALQAIGFLLSPTLKQLVANPLVPDPLHKWWEVAKGCGILGTSTCVSFPIAGG